MLQLTMSLSRHYRLRGQRDIEAIGLYVTTLDGAFKKIFFAFEFN